MAVFLAFSAKQHGKRRTRRKWGVTTDGLYYKRWIAYKGNRLFRLQKTSDEFAGKIHVAPHLSIYAETIIHIIPAFRSVVNGQPSFFAANSIFYEPIVIIPKKR